jgi:integrase
VIALKAPKKLPQVLSLDEVQSILDGCDRLLFSVLYDIGMCIGEALGLRHNDIAAAESQVTVRRRNSQDLLICERCAD